MATIPIMGIDIVGPLEKATVREYKYILTVTDHFPKEAEVIAIRDFISTTITEFIQVRIIYRFDVLETITVDNRQPFKSVTLYKLYHKYWTKRNLPRRTKLRSMG